MIVLGIIVLILLAAVAYFVVISDDQSTDIVQENSLTDAETSSVSESSENLLGPGVPLPGGEESFH